jgi:excisionase family DNA binding protein
MSRNIIEQAVPAEQEIETAHVALPHIKGFLARHGNRANVRLVVEDDNEGEVLEVPRAAVELLARILAHMAAGQGVSIMPSHAELTTQQAAELLNVSRPFLINLLNSGEIEYRLVGRHRRVKASSLHRYLRDDDQKRRDEADELSRLAQEPQKQTYGFKSR